MRLSPSLAVAALTLLATTSAAHAVPSANDIVTEVRRVTAKYQDIARARADGFVQVSGM